MAERKTGVFLLSYLTEKDKDIFTDSEVAELMYKTFEYMRTGEMPKFTKRIMAVRFQDHLPFFEENREKFDRKMQNLKQYRTESEPNRTESEQKSPNWHRVGYEYEYVNENENKRKINKKKSLSNIIEHDYSGIEIKDQRRTMK